MRVRHINLNLHGLDKEEAKSWCLKWPTVKLAFMELKNKEEIHFEACKILAKADSRFPFSKYFRDFRFDLYYIHNVPGADNATVFTRGGPMLDRGKEEHVLMTQYYHAKANGGEADNSLRREFVQGAETFIKKNPGAYKLAVVKDWMLDGYFQAHLMKPGLTDDEIIADLRYSGSDGMSEILAILDVEAYYKKYDNQFKESYCNDNNYIRIRMKPVEKYTFWEYQPETMH